MDIVYTERQGLRKPAKSVLPENESVKMVYVSALLVEVAVVVLVIY